MVLPAMLVIVAMLFAGVQLLGQHMQLNHLTQQAGRLLVLHGQAEARALLLREHPDVAIRFTHSAGTICVQASRQARVFGLETLTIGARSCVAK